MVKGDIEQDQVFKHIRTGTEYIVLHGTHPGGEKGQTLVKVGGAQPGEGWRPAVVYYDPQRNDMFIRDEANFREKFERV